MILFLFRIIMAWAVFCAASACTIASLMGYPLAAFTLAGVALGFAGAAGVSLFLGDA